MFLLSSPSRPLPEIGLSPPTAASPASGGRERWAHMTTGRASMIPRWVASCSPTPSRPSRGTSRGSTGMRMSTTIQQSAALHGSHGALPVVHRGRHSAHRPEGPRLQLDGLRLWPARWSMSRNRRIRRLRNHSMDSMIRVLSLDRVRGLCYRRASPVGSPYHFTAGFVDGSAGASPIHRFRSRARPPAEASRFFLSILHGFSKESTLTSTPAGP